MSTDVNRERIEQFRKMAADDPDNELGHWSLGRALAEAGEHAEAVAALDRALAINPNLSKAYEVKADSQRQLGETDAAIGTLQTGVKVAAGRGDRMPKEAMTAMLGELGGEVPEVEDKRAAIALTGEQVFDVRTGEVGTKLRRPPFKNTLGKVIYENVSQESWREWIGMGTKVINELRLPMSDPKAQQMFDDHMIEFLNLADALAEAKKDERADES